MRICNVSSGKWQTAEGRREKCGFSCERRRQTELSAQVKGRLTLPDA